MSSPIKCIALLSGGLDSQLAIRLMQKQGIEVEAVNFKTIFTCCQDISSRVARELGVRLTIVGQDDDYLELVRRPKFGYGKGANPCVDCRIYMFEKAAGYMEAVGAKFLVSGEVVGQRPMSQKRRDLETISHHSGLADLLLRPLSAKRLPPTLPEREGWVDREKLYDFVGRGRKGLIKLAKELGLKDIPAPSTGCALTEQLFSRNVHDLVKLEPEAKRWDWELLKIGRHFRLDTRTKVIVGRNQQDNAALAGMYSQADAGAQTALIEPHQFAAPTALLLGPATEESLAFAAGLLVRYSKNFEPGVSYALVHTSEGTRRLEPAPLPAAEAAMTLAETK